MPFEIKKKGRKIMGELWDIYDENKNKTGKIAERGVTILQPGEYHIAIEAMILNSKGQILISQRAAHKKYPLMWECNGGSALKDETSVQAILREMEEELGLIFREEEAVFLRTHKGDVYFKDYWLFRTDIPAELVTFPDGEAIAAKWVTIDEMMEMQEKGEWIGSITREDHKVAMEKLGINI